jgi:hypothetical protein
MVAMRRRIAAVVPAAAALAAACLSIPPYQPRSLVSYTEDATGATVAGAGFALHFADGSGFHFPDSLTIDGTELMGRDANSVCFNESGTGFLIFPTPRISAESIAPRVMNQLDPVLRGPAVVQVKLDWATRFTCSNDRAPHGTSIFTVFPDGQIVRHDVLADPNQDQDQISANDCKCADPGDQQAFTVTSYWTFARAAFPALYVINDGAQLRLSIPSSTDSDISNFNTVCLDGGTYQVASTWAVPDGVDPRPTTAIHGADMLIGYGLQKAIGVTDLDVTWDIHAALFLERAGCTTAFKRAAAYHQPSVLRINGNDTTASPLDGMYGGDGGDGRPGVDLPTDRATLTGVMNRSFAVWLRFSHAIEAPHATLPGATGAWVVPQRVDDRNWILWFRDPLADGQTIVIEPP